MSVTEKRSPRLAAVKKAVKTKFKINVGVIGVGAAAPHTVEPGEKGLTIGEIAVKNELGLGVPERSFLRAWVDQNRSRLVEEMKVVTGRIAAGAITPQQAAPVLGARYVGELQQFIADGKVQPPDSAYTIKQKGSSTPLIDTGQLRSSITFQVEGLPPPPREAVPGGKTKRVPKSKVGKIFKRSARVLRSARRDLKRRVRAVKKVIKSTQVYHDAKRAYRIGARGGLGGVAKAAAPRAYKAYKLGAKVGLRGIAKRIK